MADVSFGLDPHRMFGLFSSGAPGGHYTGAGFDTGQMLGGIQRVAQQQQLGPIAMQMGHRGLTLSGQAVGPSFQQRELDQHQQKIDQQQQQFNTAQQNRQQILDLLGLTPQTVGEGGLLGGNFFQSILGNSLPNVVGGITSNLPGGGRVGQMGLQDQPTVTRDGVTYNPNYFNRLRREGHTVDPATGIDIPPAQGGSLFDQLLQGRGQVGQQIMDMLEGHGASERGRIQQQQQNLQNTALARLEARGLGSSNLAGAEMERAARFGAEQEAALADRLTGQKVGALQQISEGLFGDVGSELDRSVERQRTGASLLNALLGSAFNTVSL